jgi:hypothetical protein
VGAACNIFDFGTLYLCDEETEMEEISSIRYIIGIAASTASYKADFSRKCQSNVNDVLLLT